MKNSLTSCLNSDFSSTHSNDYQVKRQVSSQKNEQVKIGDTKMMDMYQTLIIPEGMEGLIPAGYVQVDKESCAPRKTKNVTNCEHTDKKHYAKVSFELIVVKLWEWELIFA
jgi:hypothetical protein